MNICVTGGSGYLGGWVTDYLRSRGHMLISPASDFKDTGKLGADPRLLDCVVHLGWRSRAGDDEPVEQELSYLTTHRLVKTLAECASPKRIKLVFASTCSVYGPLLNEHTEPFKETDKLTPSCLYTAAKIKAEDLIRTYLGNQSLVLRLGSLMGVGAPSSSTKLDLVVNAFARDGYRRGVIQVWSPHAWKPVLHVKDAARIIGEAVERREWVGTVNAASTAMQAITIARLAAHLTRAEVRIDQSRVSPRSCRVSTLRLDRELPDMRYRTVEEAIREFS